MQTACVSAFMYLSGCLVALPAGYTSNLCGNCLPGYGSIKPLSCAPCLQKSVIIGLYALSFLVLLAAIKLQAHLSFSNQHSNSATAELTKLLVLHVQYLLVVLSVGTGWPSTSVMLFKAVAFVYASGFGRTLSVDCLLPRDAKLPLAAQSVMFYLSMPVAMLGCVWVIEGVSFAISLRRGTTAEVSMRDRLARSVLVVAFFFFVPVLHIVFSLFACMRLDTAASPPYHPAAVGSWWVLDTSQQCFTGWHAKWALGLGLPLMFVVCLVLPVCVAALTLRNRQQRRLTNPWVIKHWGFLYSAYRTQHCYWEAVVLLQTTGLVAISTFGATMAVWYQSICMTYALAVIVLMQAVWRPHALAATRAVSMQSMCCLLFTSSLGMSFLTLPGGPQPGAAYAEVVGAVMVLLHAGFVGSVVWRLLRGVDWASQRMACAQVLQRLKLDALCCAGVYMPASNKEAMGVSWGTSRQPSATAAAVLRERPVERLGRDRKPAAAAYGQRAPATAP